MICFDTLAQAEGSIHPGRGSVEEAGKQGWHYPVLINLGTCPLAKLVGINLVKFVLHIGDITREQHKSGSRDSMSDCPPFDSRSKFGNDVLLDLMCYLLHVYFDRLMSSTWELHVICSFLFQFHVIFWFRYYRWPAILLTFLIWSGTKSNNQPKNSSSRVAAFFYGK